MVQNGENILHAGTSHVPPYDRISEVTLFGHMSFYKLLFIWSMVFFSDTQKKGASVFSKPKIGILSKEEFD